MPCSKRDIITTSARETAHESMYLQYFLHRLEHTWFMQSICSVEQLTNLRVRTEATEPSEPCSQDSCVHFPVGANSDTSRIHAYIQECAIERLIIHLVSC